MPAAAVPVGEAELGGLHGGRGRLAAGRGVGAGALAGRVRDGRSCGDLWGQRGERDVEAA